MAARGEAAIFPAEAEGQARLSTSEAYLSSPDYDADIAATASVWSGTGVLETAGTFVLLTYFTIPCLLAVQPAGAGSIRTAIDGHRERTFLEGLVGLGVTGVPSGIARADVRAGLERLRTRHAGYAGMRAEYMDFVGALLAIAPLRTRALLGEPAEESAVRRYLRYMTHAMALLGIGLTDVSSLGRTAERFTVSSSGRSPLGDDLLRHYRERHRAYFGATFDALFPATREIVVSALADAHA